MLPDKNPSDQVTPEPRKMSKKSFIHTLLYNVQGAHLRLSLTTEHVWIITKTIRMNKWIRMLLPFAKCHKKLDAWDVKRYFLTMATPHNYELPATKIYHPILLNFQPWKAINILIALMNHRLYTVLPPLFFPSSEHHCARIIEFSLIELSVFMYTRLAPSSVDAGHMALGH